MSGQLRAVINCGSSSIRLIVVEFSPDRTPTVIDQAIQYHPLGRDVFTTGLISNKSVNRAVEILRLYRELLKGYGIEPHEVIVVGTAAVREASNRENFADRIEIRTGFKIRIIDGLEENRLSYMAVLYALGGKASQLTRGNTLIMEVGGGATEVILIKKGVIAAVHSLSFGSIRLQELYRQRRGHTHLKKQEIEQSVATMRGLIEADLGQGVISQVFLLGNYARIAAEMVGQPLDERLIEVRHQDLDDLAETLFQLPPEEVAKRYGIAAAAAEGMGTALLAYRYILKTIPCETVYVPLVGIAEGVAMEIRPGVNPEIQARFWNQVRSSALALAKKYHADLEHSKLVADLTLQLFDQLVQEHRMGPKQRLLLEIAALLHDIGTFVKPSAHHKHGQYIVENSEIFGLDIHDLRIIGNVVRYHRKATPQPTHLSFISLNREDRITVMKMAAILRVADALDRGHSGKIREVKVVLDGDVMELRVDTQEELGAEKLSLADKGSYFSEVFGYSPKIVPVRQEET